MTTPEQPQFVELRVQQQDTPDSISCTGSRFCAEFLPDLIEFDETKGMCAIRGGACLSVSGVEFSTGPIAPEDTDKAIEVIKECDSEALYLVDADGNNYGATNGYFSQTVERIF